MSIVDGTGAVVAEYEYDPYGNIISATGELAEVNPLRYRGYVYDQECDLYYLQSRYYDAKVGRFINADVFASTGQGLLGHNMFAYCLNNPIFVSDHNGMLSNRISSIEVFASFLRTAFLASWYIYQDASGESSNPADTPPDHPDFKPPKGGNKKGKNPNGKGKGWIDKDGNVWIWTPGMHGGEGWTIQKPGGGHGHAYPDGGRRMHCEGHQTLAESFCYIIGGGLATLVLAGDNITGIGAADDMLITVSFGYFMLGMSGLVNNEMGNECCE